MSSNIYSKAIVTNGIQDDDGNSTVDIEFAGCYGWMYGNVNTITPREINMFKQGVLAERERVWERLAEILNENVLKDINYEDLFNK